MQNKQWQQQHVDDAGAERDGARERGGEAEAERYCSSGTRNLIRAHRIFRESPQKRIRSSHCLLLPRPCPAPVPAPAPALLLLLLLPSSCAAPVPAPVSVPVPAPALLLPCFSPPPSPAPQQDGRKYATKFPRIRTMEPVDANQAIASGFCFFFSIVLFTRIFTHSPRPDE